MPERSRPWSATSSLRCLLLASLGCAASACGRSLATDFDDIDSDELDGFGGNAGSASVSQGGAGGTRSPGGAGGALVGNGGNPFGGNGGLGGQAGTGMMPTPVSTWSCEAPMPLGNGLVSCANGMLHRPRSENVSCLSELPRAEALDAADYAAIEQTAQARGLSLAQILALMPCIDDSDCGDASYGHCELAAAAFTNDLTQCSYGCVEDRDCGPDNICLCGSPVGTCVPASCERDAECGSGLLCTSHTPYAGCGGLGELTAFACQSVNDGCGGDGDCPPYAPYCALVGDHRECTAGNGCPPIGRPFVVQREQRTAGSSPRADWLSSAELARAPVHARVAAEPGLRAQLAAAWTEIALMEHASVASFARFALELVSVGAPAALLQAAASAMQDETRHAQGCFALASRYGGADVGPGPLDVTGALDGCNLEQITLGAVQEGCIGETAAALEAMEAWQHCVDEPTRELLGQIAREEAQHAELAWRFVAWALRRSAPALRERVAAAFRAALSAAEAGARPSPPGADSLLAFGIVSSERRALLRLRALREVILPCAEVLLELSRAESSAGAFGDLHQPRAALGLAEWPLPTSPSWKSASLGRASRP